MDSQRASEGLVIGVDQTLEGEVRVLDLDPDPDQAFVHAREGVAIGWIDVVAVVARQVDQAPVRRREASYRR